MKLAAYLRVSTSSPNPSSVPRLDRLARELVLQERLLAEFGRVGDVFSCLPSEANLIGDDPDDPTRKLTRQILGALNEWERATIALRLRKGRRMKAARGGLAYGSPSFGTRAEGGELVDDLGGAGGDPSRGRAASRGAVAAGDRRDA